MQTLEEDLRRFVRLRCRIQLGSSELSGHISSIGLTGAYVELPSVSGLDLDIGARVSMELWFPEAHEPMALISSVMWVSPVHDATVGLQLSFLDMKPRERDRLHSFLFEFRSTVLVADADETRSDEIRRVLAADFKLVLCRSIKETLDCLDETSVSVLIVSETLSDGSGVELLERIARDLKSRRLICINLTTHSSSDRRELVNLSRLMPYLSKPLRADVLQQVVAAAADIHLLDLENAHLSVAVERANQRLTRENSYLRRRVSSLAGFERLIGASAALRQSLAELERIRRSEVTVHLGGETGTGKELAARALHFGGPRGKGPFLAQNCAGLSETLIQSTLFGHEKGAFTGAERSRPGVFQEANGGTLFLDEVAELSPTVQASLLRTLQEREVVPLGATKPVKVDVRIVSATHKDLRDEVKKGNFREDLYYRLMVISVHMPALRERLGDVPVLATHFLDLACERHGRNLPGFSAAAMRALERYAWPGNVRELENEVERLVVLSEENQKIPLELLTPHIRDHVDSVPNGHASSGDAPADNGGLLIPHATGYDQAIDLVERALVTRALAETSGVVTHAAEKLGIQRTRLIKIRARLGI